MATMWGVHNDTLNDELIDGEFISIGWGEIGDLREVPDGRDGLKDALRAHHPDRKPGGIAGWAGILLRFRDEMAVGDIVVAPYKADSTINIGRIVGEYEHVADAGQPHRRNVKWLQTGLPRGMFSQAALYEVGSFLTVFRVSKHVAEFEVAMVRGAPVEAGDGGASSQGASALAIPATVDLTEADVLELDVPRASRIARHTRDFVLEQLHRGMGHQDFEEFTADLLRTLGYQARVTSYSQDGGVDVLAHRDPLGVEPPVIKVQCKHKINSIGAPEVQQLLGTQGQGELLLFVTLGRYTADARAIERQRPGLRLLSGEDIVNLVLDNYDRLEARWRGLLPLTPVLVVADGVGV